MKTYGMVGNWVLTHSAGVLCVNGNAQLRIFDELSLHLSGLHAAAACLLSDSSILYVSMMYNSSRK